MVTSYYPTARTSSRPNALADWLVSYDDFPATTRGPIDSYTGITDSLRTSVSSLSAFGVS